VTDFNNQNLPSLQKYIGHLFILDAHFVLLSTCPVDKFSVLNFIQHHLD